jgi:hypothetical protein
MTPISDECVQKPIILNSNEERILQAVHDLECLTLDDIMHLLFAEERSRTHVGAILRKLSDGRDYDDHQFLYRFPFPTAAKGPKERVYCLGAKAREILAVEDTSRTKYRYLTYSPILHDLMLSRFIALATKYFAAQTDYTLLETRTCYQLARNPPRITLNTNGQEASIAVIPDAWLEIERVEDGFSYPLWVEIDRATENRQRFQQLVRNRLALVNSPQYEQMFNTTAVLFCYVTTGTTPELGNIRLHNMLRWTEDLLPKEKKEDKEEEKKKIALQRQQLAALFRFTTVEYPTMYDRAHELFTQPVWEQPLVTDKVPLFDPLPPPNQQETGHGHGETETNHCRENKTTAAVVCAEAIGHDSR